MNSNMVTLIWVTGLIFGYLTLVTNAQPYSPTPSQIPATPTTNIAFDGTLSPTNVTATISVDEIFAQTATRFITDVTATAEAFPIADEDIEAVGFYAFVLAITSMAIVLMLLILYILWMNRQRWSNAGRQSSKHTNETSDDR